MSRQCVILAGGLGSRLGSLTLDTPKPMLPVAGKPFLAYVFDNLRQQSIDRFIVLAGYKGEKITEFFAGSPEVEVLIEPEPIGTGGALRYAATHKALDDQFFLINGDTFFDIDFANLANHPLTGYRPLPIGRIALRRMSDTGRYGVIVCDGTEVVDFSSRPAAPGLPGNVNGGIYFLDRAIVDYLPEGKSSIEEDVFPELVRRRLLHAVSYEAGFIDIGIPTDFERAQTYIPELVRQPAGSR